MFVWCTCTRVLLFVSVAIVAESTHTKYVMIWINPVGSSDNAPTRAVCTFLIEYNNLFKVCTVQLA